MTQKVYEAICAITNELSKVGIAKDRRNQQQGYQFRGIDDVYYALSPMLAKHKLCILPRVIDQSVVERQTAKGGVLFYTTVRMEFDFVSAEDGSKHTVSTIGEAMDSADKSSNKAQSAAYKYAAFQSFCIPTEGDNDADAHTHQVAPQQKPQAQQHAPRPLDVQAACKAISEAKSLGNAKGFRDNALSRAENDEQRNMINAAFNDYENAALASA